MEYLDQDEYIKQSAISLQNSIVNYRQATTGTVPTYVWAYRNTFCDVLSVITTTIPIRNGQMKDIKLPSKELKRIKVPSKDRGKFGGSPFEEGLVVDVERSRRRISQVLKSEKVAFMDKLKKSRYIRTTIENRASTAIQKVYRGHYIRSNINDIIGKLFIYKSIRKDLRTFISDQYGIDVSFQTHRTSYFEYRGRASRIIQCLFRRYLSNKCLLRKKREFILTRRYYAALKIQCMFRKVLAMFKVQYTRQRYLFLKTTKAARLIQCSIRRIFSKRRIRRRLFKLRWLAARMIQCWFRARNSRRVMKMVKAIILSSRRYVGAVRMQCLVRTFIAHRRVYRIKLRKLFLVVFTNARRIQASIRKYLAIKKCQKMSLVRRSNHLQDNQTRIASATELAEAKDLLELADIFLQAKKGSLAAVEDIYTGLLGDIHEPNEIDEFGDGDTVLTIAAAGGFLDIVRKCCIQWGFDVNHRNYLDMNALMLAAKNHQTNVVQYLIAAQNGGASLPLDYQLKPISKEDTVFLLSAAVEKGSGGVTMLSSLINHGLNINATSSETGMTVLLAACTAGNMEAVKYLLKNKAAYDVMDDNGQSALHKACGSSLDIVRALLGVDNVLGINIPEETRAAYLLKVDNDGKDCLLTAVISGKMEILDFCNEIVAKTPSGTLSLIGSVSSSFSSSTSNNNTPQDIGWSPNDIDKVLKLSASNNVHCLKRLVDLGFDLSWPQEVTGCTNAMMACKHGSLDVITFLMDKEIDFSLRDAKGCTALHYAASCKTASVIAHILCHVKVNQCKIHDTSLADVNNEGNTCLHIAAIEDVDISVDLLARKGIDTALQCTNSSGMTPLLIACLHYRPAIIKKYLSLGANACAVDGNGHTCMWHLFHPNPSIHTTPKKRPICSEFNARKSTAVAPSRREKDEELARIALDVEVVLALIYYGCPLLMQPSLTSVETLLLIPNNPKAAASAEELLSMDNCDVIAKEQSFTLLKALMDVINAEECWRLILSSIRFDDGSSKVMLTLIENGAVDVLSNNNNNNSNKSLTTAEKPSSAAVISEATIASLQTIFYNGFTIAGWAIRLQNVTALQQLMRRGYNVTVRIDNTKEGNTCLHLAAQFDGNSHLIDILLAKSEVKVECVNALGFTAAMICAKLGNIQVFRRLFKHGANARVGLEGSYTAWMLAFALRKEKNEKVLLTGRFGEDDNLYFNIHPHPAYSIWA